MLVGEGHLMKSIKEKISRLKLDKNVIFTGVRDDAYKYYNAFDLFVLPSLFEGLPVVSIEAQINGCKTFFSNAITKECMLSPKASFISLDVARWVKSILNSINTADTLHVLDFDVTASGYEIHHEAEKLQSLYIDLWNKN